MKKYTRLIEMKMNGIEKWCKYVNVFTIYWNISAFYFHSNNVNNLTFGTVIIPSSNLFFLILFGIRIIHCQYQPTAQQYWSAKKKHQVNYVRNVLQKWWIGLIVCIIISSPQLHSIWKWKKKKNDIKVNRKQLHSCKCMWDIVHIILKM